MARSMFSRGMLFALASATTVRRRGFMSGSPPPARAATDNSLMRRVKILPRFASAAPFLCLIVCHLEWPDMAETPENTGESDGQFYQIVRAVRRSERSGRSGTPGVRPFGVRAVPFGSGKRPTLQNAE